MCPGGCPCGEVGRDGGASGHCCTWGEGCECRGESDTAAAINMTSTACSYVTGVADNDEMICACHEAVLAQSSVQRQSVHPHSSPHQPP